jgi:transcriptional regulator with AAA-type ATPase domain
VPLHDAQHKLQQYTWPGNIRELENVIHHALLICKRNVSRTEDLHLSSLQLNLRATEAPDAPQDAGNQFEQSLNVLFEENHASLIEHIEEAIMRAAYNYCHRNQVQAARMRGISRNIIRARLIKIGEISAVR